MIERQEIHCHECGRYVQFDLDTELNGNHVLHCPVCGHEHCRVVENGVITDRRWDSRNGPITLGSLTPTYAVSTVNMTTSSTSTFSTFSGTTAATGSSTYDLWLNYGSGSGYL